MKTLKQLLLIGFAIVVIAECTAPTFKREEPRPFYADGYDMHTYEGLKGPKGYKRNAITTVCDEEHVQITFKQTTLEVIGGWNTFGDVFNGIGEQGEKIRLEFTEKTLIYRNNNKLREFKKLPPLRK